jgi:hypothetical protein
MHHRYPLHIHISTLFLALILLVCGVLGGIGYQLSSKLLEESAADLTARISRSALLEMRRIIEPAEVATHLLSLQRVTSATSLKERLDSLEFMRQALDSSPALSSLYIGYDNGDFFLVGRDWPWQRRAKPRERRPARATSCRASSGLGPQRHAVDLFILTRLCRPCATTTVRTTLRPMIRVTGSGISRRTGLADAGQDRRRTSFSRAGGSARPWPVVPAVDDRWSVRTSCSIRSAESPGQDKR